MRSIRDWIWDLSPVLAVAAVWSIVMVLAIFASGSFSSSRPQAVLVGDSLALGMAPYMHNTVTDARVGRPTTEGVREFYRQKRQPLLYVSLGTNDSPGTLGLLRDAIRRSIRRVGPKGCTVWATIHRPGYAFSRWNRVLRRHVGKHFRVVRWAAIVRDRPELLAGDHIHATPQGYKVRARQYEKEGMKCL